MFQETYSSLNDEKQWKDEFNDPLFFSHSKTNSCGVATGFCGKNSFDLIDQKSDENERILITKAKINEDNFIIINIYNSNTESEQLKTFSILQNMLDDIEISNKQIVFGGDFNLIFDCKLETNGGSPVLKKKSIAKLIEINESLNLCDIWRIRNPPKKALHISSESGFWFHSKKTRLFFRFKYTSRFCQENRCFCIFLH